jgi:hypothetical protein
MRLGPSINVSYSREAACAAVAAFPDRGKSSVRRRARMWGRPHGPGFLMGNLVK